METFGNLPVAFPDAPQKFDGWVDVLPFEKPRVSISGSVVVDGEEKGRERGKSTAAREKSFNELSGSRSFTSGRER